MEFRKLLAAFAVTAGCLTATNVAAATYNIDWTGNNGYSMTGLLSFDDALMDTGAIDETQISELSIDVMLNGVSLGTRSLTDDGPGSHASTFNLNFDTTVGQFIVGGHSLSISGQNWFTSSGGSRCDTVGFSSGAGAQGICQGFWSFSSSIPIGQPTLNATLAMSVVPLPAGGLLLLTAMGGLGIARRRRKTA